MRITTDDGVALEVTIDGSGPGLVLVHGFGGAKEDFADHIEALAATHTVVTFDHRGHGASDKPEVLDAYSFDRLAADVLAVADAVGLDQFRLLGHSMGGMIARRVVFAAPDRIEALVMMDTTPGPVPGFDPEVVEIAAGVALAEGKEALKSLLDAVAPLETPAYQRILEQRDGYSAFCDRKWNDVSRFMWAALVREIAAQPDELDALATTLGPRPALIIVGDQDAPFLKASDRMAGAFASARLAVIPDAGHSPQFENPAAWVDAMTSFLASVDAAVS